MKRLVLSLGTFVIAALGQFSFGQTTLPCTTDVTKPKVFVVQPSLAGFGAGTQADPYKLRLTVPQGSNGQAIAYVYGDSGNVAYFTPSNLADGVAKVVIPAASTYSGNPSSPGGGSNIVIAHSSDNCGTTRLGAVGPPAPQAPYTSVKYPKMTISRGVFTCADVALGPIQIFYYSTDQSGNLDTINPRSFWVRVYDISAPTAIGTNQTIALDATGNLTLTQAQINAFNNGSFSDCSANLQYSVNRTSFGCSDVGAPVALTLTVTNPSNGQSSTTPVTLTVTDVTAPAIAVSATSASPYNLVLSAGGTGTVTLANLATVSDACTANPTTVISPSTFGCAQVGLQTVTITSTDARGNVSTATAVVNVTDATNPSIVWNNAVQNTPNTYEVLMSGTYGANGTVQLNAGTFFTVADACGAPTVVFNPSTLACANVNTPVSVAYTVTDVNGNAITGTVDLILRDNIFPVANAVTSLSRTLSTVSGANQNGQGVAIVTPNMVENGSTDNCSVQTQQLALSATGPWLSSLSFTCSQVGARNIYYRVLDQSGNASTPRTVSLTVTDATAPVTNTINYVYILYTNNMLNGEISVPPGALDPTSYDNCGIVSKTVTPRYTFTCADVNQVFTLTVTNVDAAGNTSFGTAQVRVVDVTQPVITVTNQNATLGANGTVNILTNAAVTATDECGIDSLWLSKTLFTCADLGVNTINAFARDNSGLTRTTQLTVTITDQLAPALNLVASPITKQVGANGSATISLSDVFVSSTDNCTAQPVITFSPTTVNCSNGTSALVTVTSRDASNNVTTGTVTVNIVDPIGPTVTAVSTRPTVVLGSNGTASLTLSQLGSATDNCGTPVLTASQLQFTCADKGIQTITLTATDASGNVSTTTRTVEVVDNAAPVVTVVSGTVTRALNAAGSYTILESDVVASATDNCEVTSLTWSPLTLNCNDIATGRLVTVTVKDAQNNTTVVTKTVNVVDNMNPVLTLNRANGDTIRLDSLGQRLVAINTGSSQVSNSGIDYIASVTDNCGPVTNALYVDGVLASNGSRQLTCLDVSRLFRSLPSNPDGLRQFTVVSTDAYGNSDTKSLSLFVIDLWAPKVFPKNTVYYLPQSVMGTASITVNANPYNLNTNPFGLDSASSDPCNDQEQVNLTRGLLDSATQITPTQSRTYDCENLGENLYFLKITDVNLNSAAVGARVIVMDTIRPSLPNNVVPAEDTVFVNAAGVAVFNPNGNSWISQNVVDNISDCGFTFNANRTNFTCEDIEYTLDGNGFSQYDVANSVYTVAVTVTDAAGNARIFDVPVRVMDRIRPTLVRDTFYVNLVNGVATVTAAEVLVTGYGTPGAANYSAPIASDNCGLDMLTAAISREVFFCQNVGVNAMTATIKDKSGNFSFLNFTVVVSDDVKPVAATTASSYVVNLGATGSFLLRGRSDGGSTPTSTHNPTFASWLAPSTDDCGRLDYSAQLPALTCDSVGQTFNLDLYVADRNFPISNKDTVTVSVTVRDLIAPVITGPINPVALSLGANGTAAINLAPFNSLVSDNCSFVLSNKRNPYTCAQLGSNWDTLIATDLYGNKTKLPFQVNVVDAVDPTVVVKSAPTRIYLGTDGLARIRFNATSGAPSNLVWQYIDSATTDNCSFTGTITSRDLFNCSDANTVIPVTGLVTDASGNQVPFATSVRVVDTVAPIFTTVQTAPISVYAPENDCMQLVTWAVPTFTNADQNCPGSIAVTYTMDGNPVATNLMLVPVGVHQLVTTATDPWGNSRSAAAVVTVTDTTVPTAVLKPSAMVYLNAGGNVNVTSTDVLQAINENCEVDTVIVTPNTFSCAQLGLRQVTVTVLDVNGLSNTYTTNVTVVDNSAPIINLVSGIPTVTLNASGTATITAATLATSVTDNCTNPVTNVTLSKSSFNCTDKGVVSIVITATDAQGNTTVLSKEVNVVDAVAPVLTTQAATLYLNSAGQAQLVSSAVVNAAQTSDNCDQNLTYTLSKSVFSCADRGVNSVSVTATDDDGNATTLAAAVTVLDTIKPSLTLANATRTVTLNAAGSASVTASSLISNMADNCGIASVILSDSTFSCADVVAPQVINVSVVDFAGNVRTRQVTVTVLDQIAPVIALKSIVAPKNLDANGVALISLSDVVLDIQDNCTPANLITVTHTPVSVNCSQVGSVMVTVTAVDASGNTTTVTKAIEVRDQLAPTLVTKSYTLALNAFGNGQITQNNVIQTLTDNCGTPTVTLSKTNFDCTNLGVNSVVVSATDANGNSVSFTAAVTVVDNTAPVLTTPSTPVVLTLNAAGSATLAQNAVVVSTSDNCSPVTVAYSPSAFNCTNLGNNTVSVTATDASGNVTTANVAVTVLDGIAPTINVVTGTVTKQLSATGSVTILVADVMQSVTDNCTASGAISVAISPTVVNCSGKGNVPVTITATDASGNVSTMVKNVLVVDAINPTISLTSATLSLPLNAAGNASIPAGFATATDNCGAPTLSFSKSTFDCANLGVNNVTVTAVDGSGNTATAQIVVTVVDNTAPLLTLVNGPVNVALNATGTATVNAANLVANATDNCAVTTITVSPNTFSCANIGANTVTVTATDASGNSTPVTIQVNVVDNLAPVVTTVTSVPTVQLGANGTVSITAAALVSTVVDNCTTNPNVVITPNVFTCADLGQVSVTIFASDAAGNISTTTKVINVVDATAPVVVSAPQTVTLAACNAVFNYNYQVTDNCGYTATMTSGYASGTLFPVGTTTVTWQFADQSGNVTTHTFNVTVLPLGTYTLPSVNQVCADNGPVNLTNGQTGLVFTGAGVADGGTTFRPSLVAAGTYTLNFVYTDANSCTQTGTYTITVVPAQAKPSIVQVGATTIESSLSGAAYLWFKNGAPIAGAVNKQYSFTSGGNYEVRVTNLYGCSAKSNGFVVSANGLSNDEIIKSVSVFPNPTASVVTVATSFEVPEAMSIVVVDMRGAVIYTATMERGSLAHTIDMSAWPAATYQVILSNKSGDLSQVERVIKID
jgi:hypothetical protein